MLHYAFHTMHLYFLYVGILTPSDEIQYWTDLSESAEKNSVRERATHFTEQFKHIQKVANPNPHVQLYVSKLPT